MFILLYNIYIYIYIYVFTYGNGVIPNDIGFGAPLPES